MLSAQASSFRLQSRLAISLSWIAGCTNVVALICCAQVVSHQTGNVTQLGLAFAGLLSGQGDAAANFHRYGFLVSMFLLGAVCSALLTEGARRSGRRSIYIMPMTVEATLLAILMIALLTGPEPQTHLAWLYLVIGVAAFAMGLQNATITKISGAVVRTTHLTGVVTDLGLEGVQLVLWWWDKLRGARAGRLRRVLKVSRRHPSTKRVLLLGSILGSFLFGSVLGAVGYEHFGARTLAAPVLFLCWIVLVDYTKAIGREQKAQKPA